MNQLDENPPGDDLSADSPPKRKNGCFWIVLLILGIVAGAALFWQRDPARRMLTQWRESKEGRSEEAQNRSALESLRRRVEEIQRQYENRPDREELEERLRDLREEIVRFRDDKAGSSRQYWDDLTSRTEGLIAAGRETSAHVPDYLDALRNAIGSLQRMLPERGEREGSEDSDKAEPAGDRPLYEIP